MKIATLGPKGTYSEQAALKFARRLNIPIAQLEIIYTTTNNSLRLVQNRKADYAVLPAENMLDGIIGATFDALIEFQDFVKVNDEIHLPIAHVLAASPQVKWGEIKQIYSHPTALNQCQNHLEELFPKANLIPVDSTAEAAQKVLADHSSQSAAICSPEAAKTNHMNVFNDKIQDFSYNETRFFACALTDSAPSGNDRTLLAVRYGTNQPGQLFQTAKHLAESNVDLTFIQSRPYKVKPQEYVIILEFSAHKSDPFVEAALKNIEIQVRSSDGWKKILGSYPKREREEINGACN